MAMTPPQGRSSRTSRSRLGGALDAEFRAAAQTVADWQRESGLTQVDLAHRVQATIEALDERADNTDEIRITSQAPRAMGKRRRSASNSTISRWRDPARLRRAAFETIRLLAEASHHSLRDLIDRMEAARLEYELAQIGASLSVQEAIHARHQQEQDLLADFRVLDPREKRMLRAQARGMARAHIESSAPDSQPAEALTVAEIIAALPQSTSDPDEALQQVFDELRAIEDAAIARQQRQQREQSPRSRQAR